MSTIRAGKTAIVRIYLVHPSKWIRQSWEPGGSWTPSPVHLSSRIHCGNGGPRIEPTPLHLDSFKVLKKFHATQSLRRFCNLYNQYIPWSNNWAKPNRHPKIHQLPYPMDESILRGLKTKFHLVIRTLLVNKYFLNNSDLEQNDLIIKFNN